MTTSCFFVVLTGVSNILLCMSDIGLKFEKKKSVFNSQFYIDTGVSSFFFFFRLRHSTKHESIPKRNKLRTLGLLLRQIYQILLLVSVSL